jgi:hypothetical protein
MTNVLNIISDSLYQQGYGGPQKVIHNTIKGLEKISYPYELNKDIRAFKYNWIHDSVKGLIEISLNKIPSVVGPNLVIMPQDLPFLGDGLKDSIYLHPSNWCIDLWEKMNFNNCPMYSWPVGIDTDEFKLESRAGINDNVLIYFKRRNPILLMEASRIVTKMGLNPLVIRYGEYTEAQFKETLSKCRFGIWIGISESQGIGLAEALSTGLPLIVCDVKSLFESSDKKDFHFGKTLRSLKPTSAPYFDERCGIILNDFNYLPSVIDEMLNNITFYNPREYVINNLSLEKQALELLSFFEKIENKIGRTISFPAEEKLPGDFKSSFRGRLIYVFFVARRKTKTLMRLIKYVFIKA